MSGETPPSTIEVPEAWTSGSIRIMSWSILTDCDTARMGASAGVVISLENPPNGGQRLGLAKTSKYDEARFKALLDQIQKERAQIEATFN